MLISTPSLLRQEAEAVYQVKEEVFHTPWQLSHPLKGYRRLLLQGYRRLAAAAFMTGNLGN